MKDGEKKTLRFVSVMLALLAMAWAVMVWRQARSFDHDGPPLGAICMAIPSIGFLIGAAAVWPGDSRRGR